MSKFVLMQEFFNNSPFDFNDIPCFPLIFYETLTKNLNGKDYILGNYLYRISTPNKYLFKWFPNITEEEIKVRYSTLKNIPSDSLIVPFEFANVNNEFGILMLKLPYGDLFEFLWGINSNHNFNREIIAAQVGKQIGQSLQLLHSLNLCHFDVKPENILIKDLNIDELNLVLGDLENITYDYNIIPPSFTPQFLPPEYFKDKSSLGPSYDIWALGCTLYLILNNQFPFGDPQDRYNILKINNDILKNTYKKRYSPNLSNDWKEFFDNVFKKNPSNRIDIDNLLNLKLFQIC